MGLKKTELVAPVGIVHSFYGQACRIMALVSAKEEVAAAEQRIKEAACSLKAH